MPMPQKSATPRSSAGRGAKITTRGSVDAIRRSTHEVLDALPVARERQARNYRAQMRKEGAARSQAVQTMLDGFRRARTEIARETVAGLQQNMKALHQSVAEAKRNVDVQLRQIAAKRRRFASAQARFLTKAHETAARSQHNVMQDLSDTRERATHDVQTGLQRFAKGLRHDVEKFRQTLCAELGNGRAQPQAAATSKSAPVKKMSAAKPKFANGAKAAVKAKAKAAPQARAAAAKPAPAKSAPTKSAMTKPAMAKLHVVKAMSKTKGNARSKA